MKLLQRVSSVRYQMVYICHNGTQASAVIGSTFNDDRGYSARRLIEETKRQEILTLHQAEIVQCIPVESAR